MLAQNGCGALRVYCLVLERECVRERERERESERFQIYSSMRTLDME
jgi:hypothetical protein